MRNCCRRRKYCCLNNNQENYNADLFEDSCNNVENYTITSNSCDCGFDEEESVFPSNPMLAQSYVPIQTMDKTFTPCVGLKMGTIFPELVSPYRPNQSVEEIAYIEATNKIGKGCNKCN